MHTFIPSTDLPPAPNGTIRFEGQPHGSSISVFLVNNRQRGSGPGLHRHPYSETWFVRRGRVQFVAGEATLEAYPGDALVVAADTPHKFTNLGDEPLELICIHASPTFIQENLEE